MYKNLLSLSLVLFFAAAAHGTVYTVTKTADTNDGVCDSDCSLREAVSLSSNTFTDDDIIIFSPSLNGATVTVGAPAMPIFGSSHLSIEGPGADRLTISGGNSTVIFSVEDLMDVRFAGFKITGGRGTFNPDIAGGAISSVSEASIEIDRVYFTGNAMTTSGMGGALYLGNGNHRISNSTFSGNTAPSCGAMSIGGNTGMPATLTMVNTTFSGNTATDGSGGAICIAINVTAKIRNTTIVGNNARFGGAFWVFRGSLDIGNSVVAGNTAVNNYPEIQRDVTGTITSAGNNHIGDSTGDASNTQQPIAWAKSDQLNQLPLLGPLQDNGGRMPTVLPLAGSPLINSGSNALAVAEGLMIDGRGYVRSASGTVDKGAVETGSSPAMVKIAGRVRDIRGRGIPRARVVLTDMLGITRRQIANAFGYYNFTGLPAGESYFVNATAAPNTFLMRLANGDSDLAGIDITAQ